MPDSLFSTYGGRPDIDSLRQELERLGATHVITDNALGSFETKTMIKGWGQPKLGLNCVGGKSATEMARHLR
jgi:trans-2-enoyl-CoA reductase